jgi:hypothetical protein
MSGIIRYPAANAFLQFLDAPDSTYGSGSDGSVTISSNTTLTSDKFYYNLTINANTVLNTAGYRIFVKNILTLNSGSVVGVAANSYVMNTGFSGSGSISGGGAPGQAVTNSLGGNSASQSATAPSASAGGTGDKITQSGYWYQPSQAVKGYAVTATQTTPLFLKGGAGGASGSGGGVMIIAARYISVNDTATFSANGAAGSGGGGGGVIVVVSTHAILPVSIATYVAGGTSCESGNVLYLQLV